MKKICTERLKNSQKPNRTNQHHDPCWKAHVSTQRSHMVLFDLHQGVGAGGDEGGRWETKTTFVFVVSCKIHTGLLCLGRHVLRLVSLFCSVVKVEDRCSLAPAVDILSYSEREWKGNTAKSALIRKVGVCSCSQHWRQLLFHFMSTNSVCRAAPGLQRDVTQVWECEESEGGQLLCTEGHAVPGPVPQQQAACVAPRGGRWRHGKYTQSEPRSHFHWL